MRRRYPHHDDGNRSADAAPSATGINNASHVSGGAAASQAFAGALGTALSNEKERLAAAGTLAVTVSGVTLMGVGSAFWGLVFGLLILTGERLLRR